MEVELFSNVLSEEDTVEVDTEIDNLGDEGERCGICMDIVIDRGVLDCCQHWFCFVCIDNWASITNLCPLCQHEFQLITCVPVYDTLGGSKNDEESDSREDEWSVEGKNNTLSFPSYYIDENAVTCLDGDACKMRNGLLTYEETLTLDTSIACDSCDIWYHAFCVGFDPEGTGVESWLCPRCLINEADKNSDFKELYCIGKNDDQHCLVDTSTGKMSIYVADSGETAVVVSRINSEDLPDEPNANCLSNQQLAGHSKAKQSVLGPDCCTSELKKPLDQAPDTSKLESLPSAKLGETVIKSEPDENESKLCFDTGLSFASTLSDDKANILMGRDEFLHDASTTESLEDKKADVAPKLGAKRKRLRNSNIRKNDDNAAHEGKLVGVSSAKKVKAQQRIRNTLNGQADVCQNFKKTSAESSADEIDRNLTVKKNRPIDIMSIVKGTKLRTGSRSMLQKETGKCAKVEKNAAGLRVKKIMRRPSEEKESDAVVQKLRKEIREAVRNKPSDDIGKSIFDPNLLSAFRAAVIGSVAESTKNASSAIVKAKKLMLQKGKARENLKKKIYATSSGKRRRAWDRDCEIEFWKHRCLATSKPEKIDTLRSVLNLLKNSPGTKNVNQTSEETAKAPILSRLYLADTSLFPRKDDIKPLSVLKAAACSNSNETPSPVEKSIESCTDNCKVKPLDRNEDAAQINIAADDKKKSACTGGKNGSASGKLHFGGHPDKESLQKKVTGKTDDVKIDKKKWAQEFLARKSASDFTSPMHQKQDNAVLKGNYPLLAELPTDLRPKLAPTRQNKIPVSVRQVQLYRLTEHFLKMTNLSTMHLTAETELAVADAINIEKQVVDRSNSKAVYLNLCSQEIRNRPNCSSSSGTLVKSTSTSSPVTEVVPSKGGSEVALPSPALVPSKIDQTSIPCLSSEADAALRAAGLVSDSPPSSPPHEAEYLSGDDNVSVEVENEVDNIFEMDCHPDLDIYGDFEYDLDEEDYIGSTVIKPPKPQEDGESKVKVVFTSLSSSKSNDVPEANEQDLQETNVLMNTPSLFGCPNDCSSGNSALEDKVNSVPLPRNTALDGEAEELSVTECEALYGPDSEPVTKNMSDLVSAEHSGLQGVTIEKNKVTTDSIDSNVGEKSSSSFYTKENDEKEKSTDLKTNKKGEHAESVLKKVESYIKEHIRPLCKSGVITVEQYRWAVGKTTEKVMKYHTKSKNANFLIKEGEKVKKLAEQYVETAKHKAK